MLDVTHALCYRLIVVHYYLAFGEWPEHDVVLSDDCRELIHFASSIQRTAVSFIAVGQSDSIVVVFRDVVKMQ